MNRTVMVRIVRGMNSPGGYEHVEQSKVRIVREPLISNLNDSQRSLLFQVLKVSKGLRHGATQMPLSVNSFPERVLIAETCSGILMLKLN